MDEFNNGYSNGNNEQNGYGYNPSSNQQEENTTYHYSYRSSNNEGASNYYTPPQSEGDPQPIRNEKKKHKGTRKVQLDEFGNPIKPKKNKTVIAIAHRLSTLHEMDSLVVMKNGQIVETGSHTDLLKKNGEYAKFYKIQYENK